MSFNIPTVLDENIISQEKIESMAEETAVVKEAVAKQISSIETNPGSIEFKETEKSFLGQAGAVLENFLKIIKEKEIKIGYSEILSKSGEIIASLCAVDMINLYQKQFSFLGPGLQKTGLVVAAILIILARVEENKEKARKNN